jgi:RNA polymerase sigma factor for flagellar operon FliA
MPTATLELGAPTWVNRAEPVEATAATPVCTPSPDDLVHAHLGLARRVVSRLAPRLPAHVSRDDLHAAGLLGLVNAAQSYDSERGVPFELYAARRIEGAVLDELRHADWATRGVRRRERQIDDATGPLAMALHRAPTADEVAAATGLGVAAVRRFHADRTRAALLHLERLSDSGELERALPPSAEGDPERRVLEQEHLDLIARAVDALPERLRRVVRAQFFDGLTGAQLADELEVSAARVLQLRREALVLLSHALELPHAAVRDQDRRGQPSARRVAAYRAAFAASPRRPRASQPSRMPLAAARATAARAAAS